MRPLEITVAGQHFRFNIYKGHVAVNVKCHHTPQLPADSPLKGRWEALQETARDMLRSRAWDATCEWWWDGVRETLRDFDVSSAGRSGGYLTFDGETEDLLFTWEDDATAEVCEVCGVLSTHHRREESLFEGGTLPLPIDAAPWDLPCAHCHETYAQHISARCPYLLAECYSPHAYQGHTLRCVTELVKAVEHVELAAAHSWIADTLDNDLEGQLEYYLADA